MSRSAVLVSSEGIVGRGVDGVLPRVVRWSSWWGRDEGRLPLPDRAMMAPFFRGPSAACAEPVFGRPRPRRESG